MGWPTFYLGLRLIARSKLGQMIGIGIAAAVAASIDKKVKDRRRATEGQPDPAS